MRGEGHWNENDQTWLNCCIYLWFRDRMSVWMSICLFVHLSRFCLGAVFCVSGSRPSGCRQPLWALIWSSSSAGFTGVICLSQIASLSQHTHFSFFPLVSLLPQCLSWFIKPTKLHTKIHSIGLCGIIVNSCVFFYVHAVKINKHPSVSNMTLVHLFTSNFLAGSAHLTRLSQ